MTLGDYKGISWSCIGEKDYNTIKSALKLQEIFEQDLVDWKASSEMKPECGTALLQEPVVKAIYSVLKSMKEESEK